MERALLKDEVKALKNAGFKVTPDMDATAIKVNYMLATGANVVPPENLEYKCGICHSMHAKGERCPNSARKFVTDVWSKQ